MRLNRQVLLAAGLIIVQLCLSVSVSSATFAQTETAEVLPTYTNLAYQNPQISNVSGKSSSNLTATLTGVDSNVVPISTVATKTLVE